MKRLFFILLIQAAIAYSTYVTADEVRYYDFELIIFESLDNEAKISENWDKVVEITPPENFIELGKPYKGPIPKIYQTRESYRLLPRSSYRLAQEAKMLEQSSQYRILLHTAWRQPGMSEDETIPIHLHKEFTPEGTPLGAGADPTQTRNVLDGYLKIILSRYLHADFDLVYKSGVPVTTTPITTTVDSDNEGINSAISTQPRISYYHLKQTRKMRSKEVHYIDHPVLGAVILAWPYEEN